jgi:hypothetical protein
MVRNQVRYTHRKLKSDFSCSEPAESRRNSFHPSERAETRRALASMRSLGADSRTTSGSSMHHCAAQVSFWWWRRIGYVFLSPNEEVFEGGCMKTRHRTRGGGD